jgi:hypothetical protein
MPLLAEYRVTLSYKENLVDRYELMRRGNHKVKSAMLAKPTLLELEWDVFRASMG